METHGIKKSRKQHSHHHAGTKNHGAKPKHHTDEHAKKAKVNSAKLSRDHEEDLSAEGHRAPIVKAIHRNRRHPITHTDMQHPA